jgi:Zn-finger nucleic acid-binding protein
MHEPDEAPGSEPAEPLPQSHLRALRTGAFLHVYCPSCGANLNQRDWINLEMTVGGESGLLKLSSRFNVFDKEMSLDIPPPTELDDLSCPRCHASMINPDIFCERCHSKTARIRISAVKVDVHLDICVRLGCTWHALSELDRTRVVAEE